jgi:hypothetical protein
MFKKNYDSMSNKELLQVAEKKGLLLSPVDRNKLTIFRGVEVDKQGLADRQAFIERLNGIDDHLQSNVAMVMSLCASVIALASLYFTIWPVR